ncbi:MAG: DNA cytosine methyltransferase [Anaerolineaceae bacterium]|nr:MAG: DNA cytosine methyltransferase [Anaerolineaceae bacterium]
MKIASFFSGIGGFDLGFEKAGHEIVFQCEIDSFCKMILNYHWPKVPFADDILEVQDGKTVPNADVWCGGFPCQDVSLARARQRHGLNGSRSGLFYDFAELLDHARPPIVIIENVPGLLSSNGGKDFEIVIRSLAKSGYAVGWRVFNSQYFGVPQSRSRVYIVGHLGGPRFTSEILFEPERSNRKPKASSVAGKKSISPFKESLRDPRTGAIVQRLSYCLAATSGRHTGTDWSRSYVCYPNAVRRFTPVEYERLQGFPDNWTYPPQLRNDTIDYDTQRYTALGNAVSVPVAKWIGQQIARLGN